jgi:hypothetical protein
MTTRDGEERGSQIRQGLLGWVHVSDAGENPVPVATGTLALVVSHDCDLVSAEEEDVEFLRADLVDTCDGNLTYGKNPRWLQVALPDGSCVSAKMKDRFRVPRDHIASVVERWQFEGRDLYTLQRWMAGRYSRSAFPDVFNDRRRPAKDAIKRILSRGAHSLSGLYIAITDKELEDEQDYEIVLVGAVPVDAYSDSAVRISAEKVVADVALQLQSQPGIVVSDFMALSESNISLNDLVVLKRLDFDDLSVRPKSVGPMPKDL